MKHLWNLPAWLELAEAAEYLRGLNTEPEISAATILEAALEGRSSCRCAFQAFV